MNITSDVQGSAHQEKLYLKLLSILFLILVLEQSLELQIELDTY